MSELLPPRRDVLTGAAAVGVASLAGEALAVARPPASRPAPFVGMQIGAGPLAAGGAGDLDRLLGEMRERAGINTLLVFAYGHVARWVPMEQEGFRGGNFAIPHMQYYKETNLTYEDMRAPEFANVDILERVMKATRKAGMKTYALIQEGDKESPVEKWNGFFEVDSRGRRQGSQPGGPCSNNPNYRGFTQGLFEDYLRSYDIDGFMWSSERQGGVLSTLGAWHHGGKSDPSKGTCFCEFCVKKASAQGVNVEQAKRGFLALEQFVRDGRAGKKPRDGYFVAFMRLMLNYPELLQWEALWLNSRKQFMVDLRNKVKSINPATPVGFHVWHNVSFSPFYRAEIDYAEMARNADFIKPVAYNVCAGERMQSFVDSVSQTMFGDLPKDEILGMLYEMFGFKEAGYDTMAKAGFSADYVQRETRRAVDDIAANPVPVYTGIDIDIPGTTAPYTADGVKRSVLAAFAGGANGVIFARNWAEISAEHAAGVGAALRELGFKD